MAGFRRAVFSSGKEGTFQQVALRTRRNFQVPGRAHHWFSTLIPFFLSKKVEG